jgi:hypothetical protein
MTDKPDHDDDEIIPLAPVDEEAERRQRRAFQEDEEALAAEMAHRPVVPLEHTPELSAADLEHLVINYCLDAHHLHHQRLAVHVYRLRRFGELGREAVYRVLDGETDEPALRAIDADELRGFLNDLLEQLPG